MEKKNLNGRVDHPSLLFLTNFKEQRERPEKFSLRSGMWSIEI